MGGVVPASSLIQYEPLSAVPCMVFKGGNIPVVLRGDEPLRLAKGGLAKQALSVRRAGRYGDDQLIHINAEELAELKRLWGEPTINPETGLPEFFLGGLFKKLKKIFKPIAKLLPVAASFIPGIGPVAGAAIGAAGGALGGGGLKGALLGGALGGLGGASGIGTKLLGRAASPIAKAAVGNAVTGAADAAASGQNPITGAINGGVSGAAQGALGSALPKAPTPVAPALTAAPAVPTAPSPAPSLTAGAPVPAMPSPVTTDLSSMAQPNIPFTPPSDMASLAAKPNFWNQNFLGIHGLPNKFGIPLSLLAVAALSKKKKGGGSDDPLSHLPASFNSPLPAPSGIFRNLGARNVSGRDPNDTSEASYFDYSARGGPAGSNLRVARPKDRGARAVSGAGDGRSDDIPAKLSDGEYVMDAETVALLGNGSSRAGAKALDQFRANVRRHKGRNLAAGRFSLKAKAPARYLGGEVR